MRRKLFHQLIPMLLHLFRNVFCSFLDLRQIFMSLFEDLLDEFFINMFCLGGFFVII